MFLYLLPKLPKACPSFAQVIPIAMTSIESPKEKTVHSCSLLLCFLRRPCLVLKKHLIFPHTDLGIARLTWNLVKRCLAVTFIHSPSQNNEPWKKYIQEALNQGYIRPSVSPAASSFFFGAKKDGGLRPCIDYRALNKIPIKFRYPLPLVPTSLEQLRGASIFTKLDLRSAYNLIRIRDGG